VKVQHGRLIRATTGQARTVLLRFMREEIAAPLRVANQHYEVNRRNGARHYGDKFVEPERRQANAELGMVSEFLAAWYFGLRFRDGLGDDRLGIDLDVIEVRARRVEFERQTPDLAIRPDDKLHLPNVLMYLDIDAGRAELIGWLAAWQAIERAQKEWCQPKGVWFVRPPYHSILSLEQWLAAGAKPMWNPADFDRQPRSHPFHIRQKTGG
jgi:hypothetical protein